MSRMLYFKKMNPSRHLKIVFMTRLSTKKEEKIIFLPSRLTKMNCRHFSLQEHQPSKQRLCLR